MPGTTTSPSRSLREASPEAFARAEIVDSAWVGFAGDVPQAALDIIDTFRSSHSGVRVECAPIWASPRWSSKVRFKPSTPQCSRRLKCATATSFDFATGQITTTVVLESTAYLDDLRTVAAANLTNATRADIVNSITTSVVRSEHQVLGVYESNTEHEGLVTNSSGRWDSYPAVWDS